MRVIVPGPRPLSLVPAFRGTQAGGQWLQRLRA
jgi:hypothetical protein